MFMKKIFVDNGRIEMKKQAKEYEMSREDFNNFLVFCVAIATFSFMDRTSRKYS
jgi:hypothetical protein